MELYLSTAEANRFEQAKEDCIAEHTLRHLRNCPICKSIVRCLTQEDINTDENLWEYERIEFHCGLKLELNNDFSRSVPTRSYMSVSHFCERSSLRWKKVLKRTEGVQHTMDFVTEIEMDEAFKDVILDTLEPLIVQARKDN